MHDIFQMHIQAKIMPIYIATVTVYNYIYTNSVYVLFLCFCRTLETRLYD